MTPARPTTGGRAGDEALIAFYFSAQRLFERSTFGACLTAAQERGVGSDGQRIPAPSASWAWRPGGGSPPIAPRATHGDGGGYEVEDDVLVRFARASRRMLAVERASLRAKRALEAYYGDRGARWASVACDRADAGGTVVWRGAGPGSIAALYILTEGGQRFIASERARAAKRAGVAVEQLPHLTDDEVLATAFAVQAVQPDPLRRARLNRVRDEAEALLVEAMGVWRGTAPGGGQQRAAEHRYDLGAARVTVGGERVAVAPESGRREVAA